MTGLPPVGQTACLLSENSGTGTNRKISAQQLLVGDGGGGGGGDGNRHRGAVGQVVHQYLHWLGWEGVGGDGQRQG